MLTNNEFEKCRLDFFFVHFLFPLFLESPKNAPLLNIGTDLVPILRCKIGRALREEGLKKITESEHAMTYMMPMEIMKVQGLLRKLVRELQL